MHPHGEIDIEIKITHDDDSVHSLHSVNVVYGPNLCIKTTLFYNQFVRIHTTSHTQKQA